MSGTDVAEAVLASTPPPAPALESEAHLGERPTQLAVVGPSSKRVTLSAVLKHASLEMATPSRPGVPRTAGAAYVGSVIDGRYRVDGVLGRGGMGVVYHARHEVLDKPFAIKILLPTEDADVVERFVNEARAATAIGNEHIVDTIDFGQLPDGSTYFVMEYLEGRTLSQRIKAERMIPVGIALSFGKQIAEGMSAAHRAGIVHRDLKPENIFLTKRDSEEEDFVKLLDFGIAKMQARENKLTRAGTIFGTPHYMSPEQASASEVDLRADIYSLGVILYEMLAGQVPFDAENPMGLLTQHLYTTPVALTSRKEPPQVISADLDAVVLTCLAKQPADRYASMDELMEDLGRVEAGEPPKALAALVARGDRESTEDIVRQAKRRLRSYSGRGRTTLVAGVLAVFAVLGTAFVLEQRQPERVREPPRDAVPAARAKVAPVPAGPATSPSRRGVALVFSPIDAEVFRDGKSIGTMPVTVPVAKGEVVTVEIRRDGFYPEKVPLDGSRAVVIVKLAPIPGAQPRVPVPSGEPNETLRRAAAAARSMLADAGTWSRPDDSAHPATPTVQAPVSPAALPSAPPPPGSAEGQHSPAAAGAGEIAVPPAASAHP
jgi:serine/threonine-protein kinase